MRSALLPFAGFGVRDGACLMPAIDKRGKVVSGKSCGWQRWLVLGLACAFIFIANNLQFQLSAYSHIVIPQFQLNHIQYSQLFTAPMLAAVVGSVPMGALADRFGPKRVIAIANIVALVGMGLRLVAWDYASMFVSMLLLGLSPASVSANVAKMLGAWFGKRVDAVVGVYYTFSSLGIVAAMMSSSMGVPLGAMLAACAAGMVASTVAWMLLAKDNPLGAAPGKTEPVLKYLQVAGRSGSVWLIAIAFGLGLAASTAYSAFLPQHLGTLGEYERGISGYLTAMVTAGSVVGCSAAPWICEKLGAFKPFLLASTALGALLMVVAGYAPTPLLWPELFLMGLLSSAPGPILQALPYLLPKICEKYAGSAGGLIGMVGMLMAFCLPTLAAAVFGDALQWYFVAFGGLFGLSMVCIAFLPELGSRRRS